MPNHIQITFADLQPEQQDLLIAHLAEAGYEGFEEAEHALKAFIKQKDFDKLLLQEIAYKYQLTYSKELIPEKNWNAEWESGFQPVIIKDFVVIRAEFHKPVAGDEMEIIITPQMSFGTGHHATTLMMIEAMRDIDFKDKKVFDFGTGTGILAILAEKLGANEIIAIDNDDWSIANAKENIDNNSCVKIRLKQSDKIITDGTYDIILVNLNKQAILDNFSSMVSCLKPGSVLLLSGLLNSDEAEISAIARDFPLVGCGKRLNKNWISLAFKR